MVSDLAKMPMKRPLSIPERRPISCLIIKQVFVDRQKGSNARIRAFGQHHNRLGIQNLYRRNGGPGAKVGALVGCYYLRTTILN